MTPDFPIAVNAPVMPSVRHPADVRPVVSGEFWEEFQLASAESYEGEAKTGAIDLATEQASDARTETAEPPAAEDERRGTVDSIALPAHDDVEPIQTARQPRRSEEGVPAFQAGDEHGPRPGEAVISPGTSVLDSLRAVVEKNRPAGTVVAPYVPIMSLVPRQNGNIPPVSKPDSLPLTENGMRAVPQAAQPRDEASPSQPAHSNDGVGVRSAQTVDVKRKLVEFAQKESPPLPDAVFARGAPKTQPNGPVVVQTIEQPKTTASPEVPSGRQQGRTASEGLEAMVKPTLADVPKTVPMHMSQTSLVARELSVVNASEAVRTAGQSPAHLSPNLSKAGIEQHPDTIKQPDEHLGRQENPPSASKPTLVSPTQAVAPHVLRSIKPVAVAAVSSETTEVAQSGLQRAEDAASFGLVTGSDRANAFSVNTGTDSGLRAVPAHAASMVRQMADALPRVADTALEITLRPEELGRIRLTLVAAETGTVLHVTAERPETLELVRRNLGLLTQEFAAQGFGHLDVALGGRQDASPGHVSSDADAEAQTAIPDSDTPANSRPDKDLTRLGDTLDIRI